MSPQDKADMLFRAGNAMHAADLAYDGTGDRYLTMLNAALNVLSPLFETETPSDQGRWKQIGVFVPARKST